MQMQDRTLGCGAKPAFGPIQRDAEIWQDWIPDSLRSLALTGIVGEYIPILVCFLMAGLFFFILILLGLIKPKKIFKWEVDDVFEAMLLGFIGFTLFAFIIILF